MINLLPDDKKRDIKAARANVILLRYNFLTIAGFMTLMLICIAFYLVLRTHESSAVTKSEDNTAKAANYDSVRREADAYKANLSVANKVFQNSVNYTSVVFEITKLLPSGVTLDNITVNAEDFGKQISFSARAKSYDKAMELKDKFQSSKIFSNVFFQNLTDSTGGQTNGYPVTVVISAKLNEVPKQ